jgi:uncharacterized protein YkwD
MKGRTSVLFICICIVSMLGMLNPSQTFAEDTTAQNTLYLPFIATAAAPTASTGEETEQVTACELNAQETAIANLFLSDSRQQRDASTCDPILAQVARERAEDMAVRGYFDHVNPDGVGPNYLVEQAGYNLPAFYAADLTANNIESIGYGYANAETIWELWISHDSHMRHVLGFDTFYAEQEMYGMGYVEAPSSPGRRYWVIITAPAQE